MRLIFASEGGDTWAVEVSAGMTLVDVQALLEAESGVTATNTVLYANGQELSGPTSTLEQLGVKDDDVLLFKSRASTSGGGQAGPSSFDDVESSRQQILSNPQLLERMREVYPEIADAAQNNPTRFRELLPQISRLSNAAKEEEERNRRLLMSDPFDVGAQKQIEENIRRQAVLENMEHAMEYSPESFGRVVMLYVNVEINGHPVKAFVDSGAQATIMSPGCAQACGVTRLIDDRWAGMARGVGTARILGRVHSAQIKVGGLYLSCSLDILEGRDVDLLFGLDMLKRHQAVIDLKQNALIIQDRKVEFLPEHEIPKAGLYEEVEDGSGNVVVPPSADVSGAAAAAAANSARAAASASGASSAPTFPGSGQTLGGAPSSSTNPAPASSRGGSTHSEAAIQSLIALGVGREEALELLNSTNGNAEMAASLLFSSFS